MRQERGPIGRAVGQMIRRSVAKRFRNVYWRSPLLPFPKPCILCANHHGWFDGYLMFHAVTRLGLPAIDWITEFDSFPLFRFVGGMPFPHDEIGRRSSTLKKSIRMVREGWSLLIFGEGELHPPDRVLPIGRAVSYVAKQTGVPVVPVAIRYAFDLHERPEAWISFGEPISANELDLETLREAMQALLDELEDDVTLGRTFEILAPGTQDVNERWDIRNRFGKR